MCSVYHCLVLAEADLMESNELKDGSLDKLPLKAMQCLVVRVNLVKYFTIQTNKEICFETLLPQKRVTEWFLVQQTCRKYTNCSFSLAVNEVKTTVVLQHFNFFSCLQ